MGKTIKKEFDSELAYNEKHLKSELKSDHGKANTNFYNNKERRFSIYLFISNSAFRTGQNYYPQLLSEECKYVVKEKQMSKYFTDNRKISSDPDRENSDEEN